MAVENTENDKENKSKNYELIREMEEKEKAKKDFSFKKNNESIFGEEDCAELP